MSDRTISKAAEEAGVGVETIRFYERKGLIDQPLRPKGGGYRVYSKEAIERIRFIRQAQELGFTLKEIEELHDLRSSTDATCEDVRLKAQRKVDEIDQKIRTLQALKKALTPLLTECMGSREQGPDECPILEAIENPETGTTTKG